MMGREPLKWRGIVVLLLSFSLCPYLQGVGDGIAQDRKPAIPEEALRPWQSTARLHHIFGREKGNLIISADGLEFQSQKGNTMRWPFLEVQTFLLSPHTLVIETYQSRKEHLPGLQRYRLDLDEPVPSAVAAVLAKEVGRPSQNAIPDPAAQSIVIPAHHRTLVGGTNGTLRFLDDGIDFVSSRESDSRSWRWADLQTLSNPDPYHLLVFGYRDTYAFDLKRPLSRPVFNRLSDEIWSHNEDGVTSGRVAVPPTTPASGERKENE